MNNFRVTSPTLSYVRILGIMTNTFYDCIPIIFMFVLALFAFVIVGRTMFIGQGYESRFNFHTFGKSKAPVIHGICSLLYDVCSVLLPRVVLMS